MLMLTPGQLPQRELAADVVVVGAGPAGLAVASRIAATGGQVVILESGGFDPAPDRAQGLGATRGRLPYFDLCECRPRGLGGSTTLWGGWCEPLDELDFETRPLHGATGWCLAPLELQPYYQQARAFCGIPPGDPHRRWSCADDLEAGGWPFEMRSFPVLGPRQLGYSHLPEFAETGADIVLGTTITGIATSPDGASVDHLVARTAQGDLTATGDKFVLAAGGIETARLLLSSTSAAWPAGTGNGHGLVGRFFMEHPHVDAMRFRGQPSTFDVGFFAESPAGETLDGKPMATAGCLLVSASACRSENVGRVQLFIEPAGGHREHPLPRSLNGHLVSWPPSQARDGELAVIAATEQVPSRHSRVLLDSTLDRHGVPLPILRWELTKTDHRTALTGVGLLRDFLVSLGAQNVRRRLRRGGWPSDTLGGPHHLGTARMAHSPADGVVNEHCRVHGISNLFVAGGAVFPTSGHAPPTLTIIALGLRLGDHLAGHEGVAVDHPGLPGCASSPPAHVQMKGQDQP